MRRPRRHLLPLLRHPRNLLRRQRDSVQLLQVDLPRVGRVERPFAQRAGKVRLGVFPLQMADHVGLVAAHVVADGADEAVPGNVLDVGLVAVAAATEVDVSVVVCNGGRGESLELLVKL